MPANLTAPGVYIEEIPSGVKPIEGVATSTACFIGYAEKGPIGEPTLISTWSQYEEQFGGIRSEETENGNLPLGDPMGHAVFAFFLNGGAKAYIVRITSSAEADPEPVASRHCPPT